MLSYLCNFIYKLLSFIFHLPVQNPSSTPSSTIFKHSSLSEEISFASVEDANNITIVQGEKMTLMYSVVSGSSKGWQRGTAAPLESLQQPEPVPSSPLEQVTPQPRRRRRRRPTSRWIKHYSSRHRILLVGEGDFSFSACLALAFNNASNMVATSLDSKADLLMKYQNANGNLEELQHRGACLMPGVDATTMSRLDQFQGRKFHRIIFNFPHAGFYGLEHNPNLIEMHRNLVRGFLSNASRMLLPDGEIHVNHKLSHPYDKWKLKELASECSLLFIGLEKFLAEDYQGYENKRGSGPTPDRRFPLKECGTFMYKLDPTTLELRRALAQLYQLLSSQS